MKRVLAILFVCLFTIAICGCGGKGASSSNPAGLTDSVSNQVSSVESEADGTSSVEIVNSNFPLDSSNIGDYVIVLPKYNISYHVVNTVERFVTTVESKTGHKLSVVRDDVAATEHEIVVGDCDREGVKAVDGYGNFRINNDGQKLFVNGGRNYAVSYALQTLIDDIVEDNDLDAVNNSGEYASNESEYRLIWTDEFDQGESYNKNFWNDADYAEPSLGNFYGMIPYRSDSLENIYIEDGVLKQKATWDTEYFYGTFMTTKNKVMFTYGLAEISAKLADGEGLWHCFWLWDSGTTGGGNLLEFDVMECWSGAQYYLNVIHETVKGELQGDATSNNSKHSYVTIDNVWKNNSGLEFWRDEKKDRRPERLMSEEFHNFSVLWDEESVSFYRDGTCTLDYSYKGTENEFLYKNPHYIILSMAVGSNKGKQPDDVDNESKQMAGVKRPILDADYWNNGKNIFSIDYVQLFQKDGWYFKLG